MRSHCARPHGSVPTSARGPRPHRRAGQELPASVQVDMVEGSHRTLVAGIELGEAVDLVPPQVDAHGKIGGGGEDVDDAAAHRQLAPVLDLVLAPVPEPGQPGHELGLVDTTRPWATCTGVAASSTGPRRCNRARTGATTTSGGTGGVGGAKATPRAAAGDAMRPRRHSNRRRWPMVDTSGLTRSKGKRVPGREHLHRVGTQEGLQVVGDALGVGDRGGDHHHGPAIGQDDHSRQDVGGGGLGHGQHRSPPGGGVDHGGLVAQQRWQCPEAHLVRL